MPTNQLSLPMASSAQSFKESTNILKQTFSEFTDDDCPRMAAALAYYTIFSLPPLLVLIITVAGLVLSAQQVEGWIEGQVGSMLGAETASQIQTMVESAQERVSGGFSFGLILSVAGLVFGATGVFAQLQKALNTAWEVEPDPESGGILTFFTKRVFSLGMILVVAFLLLVSLLLSSLISALAGQMGGLLPEGISSVVVWIINAAVSLAVITLLFAAIFKVLPDAKVTWRDVGVGAFVTAVLFVAGKFLIGLYIGQSDPGEAYGAAAALALLLVWVYYSAMIIFLGAEFTQIWARRHGSGIEPDEDAVRVVEEKRHLRGEEATRSEPDAASSR